MLLASSLLDLFIVAPPAAARKQYSTDVLGETVQPKMPADDLQLYYWNGRGLLEVGRMVLAAAGKKAGVDYA